MRYSIVFATIVAVATSAPIDIPAVGTVGVPSITVSPIVVSGITTPKADVNVERRGVTDTTLKTEFSAIEAYLQKIEAIPAGLSSDAIALVAAVWEDFQALDAVPTLGELITGDSVNPGMTVTLGAKIAVIEALIQKIKALIDSLEAEVAALVAALVAKLEKDVEALKVASAVTVKRQTIPEVPGVNVSPVVTTVEGEAKPAVDPVLGEVPKLPVRGLTVPDVSNVDPSSTVTKVETLVQSEVPSIPGVGVPKLPVRR